MKEKFRYKKEMGQNFIFDSALIEQLADASRVTKSDGVLEIGPGRGTLTTALARRARQVIAVELDRTLIDDLEVSTALYPNVEIMQGDILKVDLPALFKKLGTPCRVAANLPYNITTPVLEMLLKAGLPFQTIAVMVQKEVGEKMTARVGDEGYGPFSLLIEYYADAREVARVPAACFTPAPKVDSSFMLLSMLETPRAKTSDKAMLFRTIRASFAMRRKTMLNNLTGGFSIARADAERALESAGIAAASRAEQLALCDFARLSDVMPDFLR